MTAKPYTREYFVEQGRKGGLANSAKQRESRKRNPGRPKGRKNKMTKVTLSGYDAISFVERGGGATLYKYADPVDGPRSLFLDEAYAVAKEDPSLVYCSVWRDLSKSPATP